MKIFRTDLHVGLNKKLFEISSSSLELDNIQFSEEKIKVTIHSEDVSHGYYMKGLMAVSTLNVCDRCLIDYYLSQDIKFSILLTNNRELINSDEHDVIFFTDQEESVDISSILAENIQLNQPFKNVCSNDCKGLCSSCGCNKNIQECSCMNST